MSKFTNDNVRDMSTAKVNKAKSASGWNIKLTLEVAHLLLWQFYIFINVLREDLCRNVDLSSLLDYYIALK